MTQMIMRTLSLCGLRTASLAVLILALFSERIDAYSAGPPDDACITREPGHGYSPQSGACPYTIDARNWIPGQGSTSKLSLVIPAVGMF